MGESPTTDKAERDRLVERSVVRTAVKRLACHGVAGLLIVITKLAASD